MFTISESTFDSSEDYLEVSSSSKPEETEVEDALLSRSWILFGTSLTVEDSSLGNSLKVSETPEEGLTEFAEVLESFAGRINVGSLVIGDINATRLKFVGVQSFNEVSSDWKTYTIRISNQDLPGSEGATLVLVIGLDGAQAIAVSPAIEVPQGELLITFQAKESVDGQMVLDNVLVQADQPAPNKNDCPELVDFFNVIKDMSGEGEEIENQTTLTLLK
jgi:hypothetical protein